MHAFLDTQCTHICKHMHRHVNTLRNTFIPLLIDQRNDLLLEVVAVLAVHCIQRRVVLTNKWLSLFYFSIKIWPMHFIGMKWASILKDSSVEVSEGCKGDMKESTESLLLLSLSLSLLLPLQVYVFVYVHMHTWSECARKNINLI